jgi:hypothetical protein
MSASDPKRLKSFLSTKGVSLRHQVKIRAMRQLLAVEKTRGPEAALAPIARVESDLHVEAGPQGGDGACSGRTHVVSPVRHP